jgi:predicted Zn-dependent protease
MMKLIRAVCLLGLGAALALPSAAATPAKADPVMASMEKELARAGAELGKLTPAAYYIAYTVHDESAVAAVGMNGSLVTRSATNRRSGDVILRVGSPAMDNSHGDHRGSAIHSASLPLAEDGKALAHALWKMTYTEYRRAATDFANVQTSSQVKAKEDDLSADFSQEKPSVSTEYHDAAALPDMKKLEEFVRRGSAGFRKYPYIYSSGVVVSGERSLRRFVSSEGSRIISPGLALRVVFQAQTRAEDGMELMRVETMQVESLDKLPSAAEIEAMVERMAHDLKALREAPVAEPFDGPALLSGRASGVFFHEVLGHRLEGQRQRGDKEGQTFTKKLNELVLPEFLSVADDPTQSEFQGTPLAGTYAFDDEGVPAQRVEVIQKGVLKNFLLSRMPIAHFDHSNGHGRAQAGLMPVGRQGNLIVSSSKTVKESEMRQQLVDEVKRQGKPYGLYFEDIQGGFTLTQRAMPQAFQVLPVMVWRVYADGRPDELVRGVDIVGTPLAAMTRILVTGDKPAIFNGVCGAESGGVPVSAVAPSILFSEIEVQKRAHNNERLPILPAPGSEEPAHKPAAGGQ